MRVLALESSTEYCSAALSVDGEVIGRQVLAGQAHSQLLLPMVGELLGEAGCTLGSLDGIGFGCGPGSFTGLRIACGVCQGLALGAQLPVIPVVTLEALAEASGGLRVAAALDARMGEIYFAAYERTPDGDWAARIEPRVCLPETLAALPEGPWLARGSGFAAPDPRLGERLGLAPANVDALSVPTALAVAALAAARLARGLGITADQAAPLYLRNKVARTSAERRESP